MRATGSYTPLFYGTSFFHYLVYIATYHQRTGIAYGAFKRDALLFKSLALTQVPCSSRHPLHVHTRKGLISP